MALGTDVALILRARGGTNFMTQTHGVNTRDANEASRELMTTLVHTKRHGASDPDGSGDTAPGFASGQLLVCRERFLVVYRLVNTVWVITVAPASANVLLCSHIISATTRLLIAAAKGTDVTPDKLARSYPEVYLATGQLLKYGGLSISPAMLLSLASSDLMSISPEPGKASGSKLALKPPTGVLNRFGLQKKPLTPTPSTASFSTTRDADVSTSARSKVEDPDYAAAQSFVLPQEVFAARPRTAIVGDVGVSAAAAAPSSATPDTAFDDLFGPAIPVAGSESLAGTGLETLEAPGADYGSQFANLRPPPPPPVSDNPWGDFDTGAARPSPFPGAVLQPPEPPKPVLPPPTAKQQRAIANGNALQLVELWKASFVGPRLDMAGTFGEVLATGAIPKCAAEATVQLRYDAEGGGGSAIVALVAQGTGGQPEVTEQREGSCIALLSKAHLGEVPFLKYKLQPIAVMPPLLLAVTISEKAKPRGAKKASVLQLQLDSHQELGEADSYQEEQADLRPESLEATSLGADNLQESALNGASPRSVVSDQRHADIVEQIPANGVHVEFDPELRSTGRLSPTLSGASLAEAQTVVPQAETYPNTEAQLQSEAVPANGSSGEQHTNLHDMEEAEAQIPASVEVAFHPEKTESLKHEDMIVEPETEHVQPQSIATDTDPSPLNAQTDAEEAPLNPEQSGENPNGKVAGEIEQSEMQSAPEDSLKRVTVHLAISPHLLGPLRGVCVDLDIHPGLGDIAQVAPAAKWAPAQRRLRWELFQLEPGSKLKLLVACKHDSAAVWEAKKVHQATVARLHAFGPAGTTLSGISLLSGSLQAEAKPSRSAFHCEVSATAEPPKEKKDLTRQDRIEKAIREFQAHRQNVGVDGSPTQEAEDSTNDYFRDLA